MSWRETCFDEAVALADRLGGTAVFYQDRCNWVTRRVLYAGESGGLDELPRLMNLNPSIYSGTAGMALLFARLWNHSQEERHLRWAAGAIKHAVRHAIFINDTSLGKIGSDNRFGFYIGTAGIAWAANEVGTIIGDQDLRGEAMRLLGYLNSTVDAPHADDLMLGPAGGAMVGVSMAADKPVAEEFARNMGERILASAHPDEESGGLSWGNRIAQGRRNLTGFSHGTAGHMMALAHLYRYFDDDRYLEALEGAQKYEDHAFVPERNNWYNYQNKAPDGQYPSARAWCHGAVGIGIGRVFTDAALPRPRYRRDVEAAIKTTREALDETMREPGKDWMTCHGVAGTIESLWIQGDYLEPGAGYAEARSAMKLGLDQHGMAPYERWGDAVEWPTPITKGLYPPLLTGAAGIAYLLLRFAHPEEVPTVLAPGQRMLDPNGQGDVQTNEVMHAN